MRERERETRTLSICCNDTSQPDREITKHSAEGKFQTGFEI
jgi:hypothetical protein